MLTLWFSHPIGPRGALPWEDPQPSPKDTEHLSEPLWDFLSTHNSELGALWGDAVRSVGLRLTPHSSKQKWAGPRLFDPSVLDPNLSLVQVYDSR